MLEMLNSSGRLAVGPLEGQTTWTTPGTYTWICPPGVKEICLLLVGAAMRGLVQGTSAYGGYGGQVRWWNKIQVNPGQAYTVVVGSAGD